MAFFPISVPLPAIPDFINPGSGPITTNPRFPLPDILEEIERANRYSGKLMPGSANEAAL